MYILFHNTLVYLYSNSPSYDDIYQARVQGGGGPRGLDPPPLEIEKQKKNKIK